MALRRAHGFKRYAFSLTYHGALHLGVAYQGDGKGENCILPEGTDLRGVRSVEGRVRGALASLVGGDNYENLQVSSRTDRGVHSLMNTCHVDIRPRRWTQDVSTSASTKHSWDVQNLRHGLNYYLRQQADEVSNQLKDANANNRKRRRRGVLVSEVDDDSLPWLTYKAAVENSVRILNVQPAPASAPNKFFTGKPDCTEPEEIDWNIRFSATSRTYCYRILHMIGEERDAFVPFEYDRSWRIVGDSKHFDVDAMREASEALIGTHDFTSFRGKGCQRSSPIVTLNAIEIDSSPYSQLGQFLSSSDINNGVNCPEYPVRLYTIKLVGESFVYRQVRNIVGCLVSVGQGKLSSSEVKSILEKRERRLSPAMAPAHGLFLTNVTHYGIKL